MKMGSLKETQLCHYSATKNLLKYFLTEAEVLTSLAYGRGLPGFLHSSPYNQAL